MVSRFARIGRSLALGLEKVCGFDFDLLRSAM